MYLIVVEVCLSQPSIGFAELVWQSGPLNLDTESVGLSQSSYAALLPNPGSKALTCPHVRYRAVPGDCAGSCKLLDLF